MFVSLNYYAEAAEAWVV